MTPTNDDSPSIIGADIAPMPTDAEHKAAFKKRYIELFSEIGVDGKDAGDWFDAAEWEEMKTLTPEEAVAEEMSYWDNE